jgi:DNA-binding transcriptional regulator LsrR (DeoR family)
LQLNDENDPLLSVSTDQLRILTKIAVLYHEENLGQGEIAGRLNLSQARISRYMSQAEDLGIIRTSVVQPLGIFVGLERALELKYGLREVVVVENIEGSSVLTRLGSSAATYLETTLSADDFIGISSWSTTLLATVEAMRARPRKVVQEVSQLIGGVGSQEAQVHSTRLTSQLAQLTSAKPNYLAAPGLSENTKIRDAFLSDSAVQDTMASWKKLTAIIVGIGIFPASPMLKASGNAIKKEEEQALAKLGAVGEICLRYFDSEGKPMSPDIENRMISIESKAMMKVPRRIGVAGGMEKLEAIRAAITGGWLNILITDSEVAQNLLEPPRAAPAKTASR